MMRASITIPDERLEELLIVAGTRNRTVAVNQAIEAYVRQRKRERLAGLAGGVDILDNEAIEAADQAEARALRRQAASPREDDG